MIVSALIMGRAVLMPHLIEFPTPSGDVVAIEVLIELPPLEPGHRFRLEQAARNAIKMTPQYGRRDISRILAPGYRFRIDQLADALRIGLTVEPKDLGAGLSVLSSVLTDPTFLPDAIKIETVPITQPWQRAIRSFETAVMEVDQASLRDVWKYVIRPEAITIGVRGPVVVGRASQLWRERERFWQEYAPQKTVSGRSPKLTLDIGKPPILVLASKIPLLNAEDLLAATLMGGGKDSILWRLCREQLKMSYLQDAFLVPTQTGWEFRIAIATDQRILEEGAVTKLLSQMVGEIERLSEKDLQHARGLLKGYFEWGQPGLPIKLGQTEMTSGDDNEILFRDLYLNHKKSATFSAGAWISGAGLDTVRSRLKTLLENSSISFK